VNRSKMHRNTNDDVKTGLNPLAQDKLGSESVCCPSGIRCRDGVTFTQAFVWNAGTSRFNVKGEVQMGDPHENESPEVKHWGGTTRSSDEASVMGVERRGRVVQFVWWINHL